MALTYKIDSGVTLAQVTCPDTGIYFEIPLEPNYNPDTIEAEINEKIAFEAGTMRFDEVMYFTSGSTFVDELYYNGNKVRTDYKVNAPEAIPIIDTLVNAFPDDYVASELQNLNQGMIANYSGYREPYTDNSISLYYFEAPSNELLDSYQVPENIKQAINPWYAIKHDLTAQTKSLKVMCNKNDSFNISGVPSRIIESHRTQYGRLFNSDGSTSSLIDIYFFATKSYVQSLLSGTDKNFPAGEDIAIQWYSLVFDESTQEIVNVKGYLRKEV